MLCYTLFLPTSWVDQLDPNKGISLSFLSLDCQISRSPEPWIQTEVPLDRRTLWSSVGPQGDETSHTQRWNRLSVCRDSARRVGAFRSAVLGAGVYSAQSPCRRYAYLGRHSSDGFWTPVD